MSRTAQNDNLQIHEEKSKTSRSIRISENVGVIEAALGQPFTILEVKGSISATARREMSRQVHSPGDTIVKDFRLLSLHWKDTIEGENILLRGTFHLDRFQILIECDHDIAALANFQRVWWTKPWIERRGNI